MIKTYDEMALDILMSDVSDVRREEMLRVLHERAQESLGLRCPCCGSVDTESNVDGSTYLCRSCSVQWETT